MSRPDPNDRLGKSFTFAVALFSLTLAAFFFLQSPFFSLQEVQVYGNVYLREVDLLRAGQISYGQNLFDVNLRDVERRLEGHPQIESARVTRRLPGTMVFDMVEREPVAFIPSESGFAVMDVEGRILQIVDAIRLPLPLITGLEPGAAGERPGSLLAGQALHDALRVAVALRPDLVGLIGEIQLHQEGLVLLTRDLISVQLGGVGHLDEKLVTLRALLRSLANEARRVERIDLRVPRTPVLR